MGSDGASTYSDLLARLGDAGTKELFRRLSEEAIQELIGDGPTITDSSSP